MKGRSVKSAESNIEIKPIVKPCYYESNFLQLNNHILLLSKNGLCVDYNLSEKITLSIIFINTFHVFWI